MEVGINFKQFWRKKKKQKPPFGTPWVGENDWRILVIGWEKKVGKKIKY